MIQSTPRRRTKGDSTIAEAPSTLVAGLEQTVDFTAEGSLLTDVDGSLPRPVLSTPGMIGRMERAATLCAQPHLSSGMTTVGFEVCVKHVAAAQEGAELRARAALNEVADGRKLRFDVEVTEGTRVIGVGRHERRIIAPR